MICMLWRGGRKPIQALEMTKRAKTINTEKHNNMTVFLKISIASPLVKGWEGECAD
jgi:hypothetical protein